MENENGIIYNSLDDVFKTSMIAYAEDVILDRALPRVEDGLKPVQRRILYDMYENGITPDKPHKKCAKIVGDCLGKYHPHGDGSVYGALVHIAQDFNMRNPLIDGHGNFGTIDGDSAAAYRYTEARLSPIALELLRDIEKDTVNFSFNFDDTLEEPNTLPGRFPNLLVNGAMGIAVGLATNIPTHNLCEVIDGTIAYIDNPKISLKELMLYIKAPDFPTGGYIVCGDELVEAYKTGKGKIKIRARVIVEKDGDKQNLVITEIPYTVNKSALLKKIVDLKEEKKDVLGGIKDVVDESDRNGMRAVIKLSKDADAQKILKYLYKSTDLEISYGINMVAIANGKPCQLSLTDIIAYYVNYQREIILRRSKFELDRAKERAHIVEGLIVAVKNIDEVIKIIKGAENTTDARNKLKARFNLSEAQTTAILDLRLARLTKLEVEKLVEELKQLKKLIEELTSVIASRAKQMTIIKNELTEIKKKYGDKRRSHLITTNGEINESNVEEELKQIDDFVIGYTFGGTVKKMTEHNFNASDKKVKDTLSKEDCIAFTVNAKSNETLLAFTNLGNCFKIPVSTVSECRYRDKGVKFNSLVVDLSKGEVPVAFFSVGENYPSGNLVFVTKESQVKLSPWAEYNVNKQSFSAIKLKDKDQVISVETEKKGTIMFVTEIGMSLNMLKDDVGVVGRVAGGVRGMLVNYGDKIILSKQVEEGEKVVVVTDGGYYKLVDCKEIEPSSRNRKGVKICDLGKNKIVYADIVKEDFDIAVIDTFQVAFKVSTKDVSIEPRANKGKQLKTENKKRCPEKAFKLY